MNEYYPPIIIENCHLVTPDAVIERAAICMSDGVIADMGSQIDAAGATRIDANGGYVLPGLVDLHSDALEKAIAVRASAPFPPEIALFEFDKTLVGCGVTSMFYCVSFMEGNPMSPQRTIAKAREQAALITQYKDSLMTNSFVHARIDLPTPEAEPATRGALQAEQVHLLSLNDHTPGQGQHGDLDEFLEMRKRRNPETPLNKENLEILVARHEAIDYAAIENLVKFARDKNIPVASHDDDSADIVHERYNWGVGIAEFPVNDVAVSKANELEMPVVLGAPNALRGMSHGGNISARDAVEDKRVDCICSDYSPMSMLQSLFLMVEMGLGSLEELTRLYTLNPAMAAGLGATTGSLEPGKAADLILVRPDKPTAKLEMTFVAGRPVVVHAGGWQGSVAAGMAA